MEISKDTLELASLFAASIRQFPNDPKAVASDLRVRANDKFETILNLMNDPTSELAIVLATFGNAFHSTSAADVPVHITADDIPEMARKIRMHASF